MIGGHYTYAEVPWFDFIRQWFGGIRNNYDKIGHFAQGFIPALITREIIIRKNVINGKVWQSFFIVCFCLAFSAFYELIEWWVALGTGEDAEAFLGTQGYIWDTEVQVLKCNDIPIELTKYELILLTYLVNKENYICTTSEITDVFYSKNIELSERNIRNQIFKLRKRVPEKCISSVYGLGYKFTILK